MAHEKFYGYCENLCNVEVEPKSRTENLYNPNLLVNCDDFSYFNVATIDEVTNINNSFNVILNNMLYEGNGFSPHFVESSGDVEMRYRIMRREIAASADRLPMTLQVRFGAREGLGVTTKTYVFNEPDDEFTETMGSVTWRITLTGYSAKIYWTKAANVSSDYMIAGAKLELGNVPTRYDISNTLGKTIDLVWTESKNTFEKTSNKVTSISSSSTDEQYPSAKVVYRMLNHFLGEDPTLTWKSTPSNCSQWYFYEAANTLAYDLPTTNCFVLVFKKTATRGAAFAFGWDGVSTNKTLYKNTCQDTWKGWVSLPTN